ncbi:hypothetical protein EB796_003068 [Bugula neritina]|uniref:Uncharacterized protein n=1 Tax=Bugula neritina TaxID=10212 RepID=A0A7J7KIT6_BUGNE|nr:hypothetical protein EB796_003068 [Bugula neritina]
MSLDWEGGFNMPTSKLYTIIVLEKALLSPRTSSQVTLTPLTSSQVTLTSLTSQATLTPLTSQVTLTPLTSSQVTLTSLTSQATLTPLTSQVALTPLTSSVTHTSDITYDIHTDYKENLDKEYSKSRYNWILFTQARKDFVNHVLRTERKSSDLMLS